MNICSFNSIPCFDGDKFCGGIERNVVYLWTHLDKSKYKNEEDCREAMRIRMSKVAAARWGNKNWTKEANMGQG
jgi:hypothetical protein